MALLIKPGRDAAEHWVEAISEALPDLDIRVWPEVGNRAEIEYVLANSLPEGEFATFPNLKFVVSTAVTVERLVKDKALPAHVPILRSVNPERTAIMTGWVLYHVIRHHRRFDEYRVNQAAKTWEPLEFAAPEHVRVGVMGLGSLGGAAARALAGLRYAVAGWARSRKDIPGVESFAGMDEFEDFLARSDIIVSILPNTKDTAGLLDARRLALLPRGAYVINAGRATLIDDDALLAALDSGALAGAALDVFRAEPLPPDHPYWSHPKVTMTPHYATHGRAVHGAGVIVQAIRDTRAGRPLTNLVDREAGY